MLWFLWNKVITAKFNNSSKLDTMQYLKSLMRIPMVLLTVWNVYMDIGAIRICKKYQVMAQNEGNQDLAKKFKDIGLAMIILLQIAMIPRYFMIIWTSTFMGACLPDEYRQWIFKNFLDAAKECPGESDPTPAR